MGKDDEDVVKGLALIAGIGAGLWLLKQIFGKNDVQYYRCWNCRRLITPYTSPCPFCRVGIDWSNPELHRDNSTGKEGYV